MKSNPALHRQRAFTSVEMIVVMFSVCIMAILLLSALSAAHVKREAIGCVNHLKLLGLGTRLWEGDNSDHYPRISYITNGAGLAEGIFMTLSNQLPNPRVLVCPADRRRVPASSFRTVGPKNLSYFYNPDAPESNPQDIMMGDDNLTLRGVRVKSGLVTFTNTIGFRWTADRHNGSGNLALADGSVQSATASGLVQLWANSTNQPSATNEILLRLVIP